MNNFYRRFALTWSKALSLSASLSAIFSKHSCHFRPVAGKTQVTPLFVESAFVLPPRHCWFAQSRHMKSDNIPMEPSAARSSTSCSHDKVHSFRGDDRTHADDEQTQSEEGCLQAEPEAGADTFGGEHPPQPRQQLFGRFVIDESHVFYRSPSNLSAAIVNLRPIVPGHVLVIPRRVAERLSDLTDEEYFDLWRTVRVVQRAVEKLYGATSCNVAVQDGVAAGQSVPHTHVHILPRTVGDYEVNDDIYDDIESWAPRPNKQRNYGSRKDSGDDTEQRQRNNKLTIPTVRRDRTFEQMAEESNVLRGIISSEET